MNTISNGIQYNNYAGELIDSNRRTKIKEFREQQVRRTKFNIFVIVAIIIINITIIACSLLVNAQEIESYDYTVQYISIEIEQGDSLWSVAQEYKSNPELSTKEAINEIKSLNHLSSDHIYAGQYIIVPNYLIIE